MQRMDKLYSSRCSVCGGHIHNLSAAGDGPGDWDKLLNRIAKELYDEKISKGFIDNELYNKTAERLIKAAHEGLGGISFAYDDERNILKAYLEQNIYKFSAAKTLAETEEFKRLMINPDGTLSDFVTFRNRVSAAGYKFNETFLKTEFDTAYQSALMAHKWAALSLTSDYLEYSTAQDDRVRPEHAALDGLTLPVDSPVWATIWPPVDWNCRCTIVPGVKDNVQLTDKEAGALGDFIKPYFRNNSGKTKTIYKDDHPYFVDANFKEHQLDAVKNYGLKNIDQIFAEITKLPVAVASAGIEEFYAFWEDLPKIPGTGNVVLQDPLKTTVIFDAASAQKNKADFFKDHLFKKASEARYSYAANFIDVLQQPNEIWSAKENGKLVDYYIKYYQDGAYTLVVRDMNNQVKGENFYKLTDVRLKELRKGILKFSK